MRHRARTLLYFADGWRAKAIAAQQKKMKFVWKRTRHSLKKRDELKFRKAQIEIEDMLAAVDHGEIEMAYCDEAGFAPAHPNRSA